MSETRLTQDEIADYRRRVETIPLGQARDGVYHAPLTKAEMLRLLDAAERAESALAPLRAVGEAAKAFMLKWPELEGELSALREALDALPADPSALTPR